MTAIDVRIYSGADPTEMLAVLERTRARQWTDALNETGAGSFEVAALHPKIVEDPTLLDYGNIVKFAVDDQEVFAFVIEKRVLPSITESEDVGRWYKVSGRGLLAILESAIVYPEGPGLAGNAEREWMDASAGTIMAALFDEAIARGALPGVTRGFTGALDSYGDAYTEVLDLSERAGTDLLRVALRHAELAVDVYMTVDLELRYFNLLAVDQSLGDDPVQLTVAKHLEELELDGEGVIRNTLLVEGPAGFTDRQDAGSATVYGRREGFLTLGNAKTNTQLNRAADRVLQGQANPSEAIRVRTGYESLRLRPYVDYAVGDYLWAPTSSGRSRQRVRAITVQEDDEGRITVVPELATRRMEFVNRLARWLKTLSGGSLGGTAAAASSPTADTGTLGAIAAALAAHVAAYAHPDELGDLVDVDVTPVSDGDVLTYDDPSNTWIAAPIPASSGSMAGEAMIAAGPVTWTNMPAVETELGGVTYWRTLVDATSLTEVRLVASVATPGVAGSVLRGQYSNDEGATWFDLVAGDEPEISVASAGIAASNWGTLVAGATEPIFVRVVGELGDGASDPVFVNVALQFR